MKIINNAVWLTTTDIAMQIGRSPQVVREWIKWFEHTKPIDPMYQLPQPSYPTKHPTRYYDPNCVKKFEEFGAVLMQMKFMADWNYKKSNHLKHKKQGIEGDGRGALRAKIKFTDDGEAVGVQKNKKLQWRNKKVEVLHANSKRIEAKNS